MSQLTALQKLTKENPARAPDALVVGIGAWWVEFRKAEHDAYVQSVRTLVEHLDTVYAEQRVVRIFSATTSCGKATAGEEDGTSMVVHRFNAMAKRQVLSAAGWSWFDRDVVTGEVCDRTHDCAGDQYSSRFHPAGDALNVVTRLLLDRLALAWAVTREPATQLAPPAVRVHP